MQTQAPFRRPAVRPTKSTMLSHVPVRVFLLSDCKILRETLVRVFNADFRIALVAAQEFSATTVAEIAESACNVLLIDPVHISAFDTKILDLLRCQLFPPQIVTLEREAGIDDVLSSILTMTQSESGFPYEARLNSPR